MIRLLKISKIFCLKPGFLAVPVRGGTLIVADRGRPVDDPRPDVFRIVADLQILQTVASMENPFFDIPDILR